jgi:hypothetical protein
MTSIRLMFLLPLLLSPIISAGQSSEESNQFAYSMDTGVLSKFVWRGFVDYNGPSWQTTARLDWKGIEGSWWMDTGKEPGSNLTVREHDIDVHYSHPLRGTTFSAGYTAYCMLLGEQTAHEIYVTASRGSRLVGTIGIYQNLGSPNGTYFSASLNRSLAIRRGWIVQLGGSLGFNRKMYIDTSTFSDATATITFSKSITKSVTLLPTLGFSKGLNSKYFSNQAYGGMTLRYLK